VSQNNFPGVPVYTANPTVAEFPWWVWKKIGYPIFTECDWPYTQLPNTKYGALHSVDLYRDETFLKFGGKASCAMLVAASNGAQSEVKTLWQMMANPGDLLAFEFKWLGGFLSSTALFDCGIESRTGSNIVQGRFRYTGTASNKWQYESAANTYSDFPDSSNVLTNGGAGTGPLNTLRPQFASFTGSNPSWCRVIIDPTARNYVGFEANGVNGIEIRDMRTMGPNGGPLPLISNGSATVPVYLFFNLLQSSGSADICYTTDWCASIIPAGTSGIF